MSRFTRIFITLFVLALTAASGIASAANYTLWINGRTGGGVVGNYNSFTYWGPSTTVPSR